MRAGKVVAVVRQPSTVIPRCPPVPGLTAGVLHTPTDGEPGSDPDVAGVWMLWVDDVTAARAALGWADAAYFVEERRQWGPARGDRPGAVTRLSFVRRAPALTRQAFGDHWRDVHAPLARQHHPGLWRYVQNVVIEPLRTGSPDVDGIAELGFRDLDDLRVRMYDSADGRAVIGADVRRFIDTAAGWRLLSSEQSVTVSDSNAF